MRVINPCVTNIRTPLMRGFLFLSLCQTFFKKEQGSEMLPWKEWVYICWLFTGSVRPITSLAITQAKGLFALMHGVKFTLGFTGVQLTRTRDTQCTAFTVHFIPVCNPANGTGNREDNRKH